MKKIILLFLLCFMGLRLYSQSFYVVDPGGTLYTVTVKGNLITYVSMSTCGAITGPIAAYKKNLFYTSGAGLIKADISGVTISNCNSIRPVAGFGGNSLTSDANGRLYTAGGSNLYRYDPATSTTDNLGTMPYSSSGDLIFYKTNLYMASGQGIVKINLTNLSQSQLVIPAVGVGAVFGLASVPFTSTSNKIYEFAVNGTSTDIIELDLDNNLKGAKIGSLPFIVNVSRPEIS